MQINIKDILTEELDFLTKEEVEHLRAIRIDYFPILMLRSDFFRDLDFFVEESRIPVVREALINKLIELLRNNEEEVRAKHLPPFGAIRPHSTDEPED
jgi:hypothetical protein